jgi:hypothetical protein
MASPFHAYWEYDSPLNPGHVPATIARVDSVKDMLDLPGVENVGSVGSEPSGSNRDDLLT